MSPVLRWDGSSSAYINLRTGQPYAPTPTLDYDWSDENPPWAGTLSDWEAQIPAGMARRELSAGSTFRQRLINTCNAASGRTLINIPAGVYTFEQFVTIGSGSNPTYAFGFFDPKLAGFVFEDVENTIIEMAPDSVNSDQLDYMKTMPQSTFVPLNMGMIRIDTQYQSAPAPVFIGGGTFEAAPQNLLTAVNSDVTNNVYVPQSAPHHGVVFYSDSSRRHPDTLVTHTRFRGAGKAMTSQPPFEMANFGSQRNHITFRNCEFDGRMSPRYDATRPRKCGPIMHNGGVQIHMFDCWMHHSNISRYAANDESVVSGTALSNHYTATRCKSEQITNNQNRQPPINGGNSLGGFTNASAYGWESTNALIEITDCIVSQDNPNPTSGTGQIPTHLQLTNVGGVARVGGRIYVRDGDFRDTAHPHLSGFTQFRISQSTNWWTEGFENTIHRYRGETRLSPHVVTDTWPPSAGALAAAGVTPETHYLVRST